MLQRLVPACAFAAGLSLAAGCAAASSAISAVPMAPSQAPPGSQPIQHVVILVQENRSFDNLFATYPKADGTKTGKTPHGTVSLRKSPLRAGCTLAYQYQDYVADYDGGKMDGFAKVPACGKPGTFVYQYVDPMYVKPYWSLAQQYVLADHTFATQGSASFTAHQDLIAGDTLIDPTHWIVDIPNPSGGGNVWGCDASKGSSPTVTSLLSKSGQFMPNAGPFPCFTWKTMRDTLDARGVTWKYYTPQVGTSFAGDIWNAFDAIRAVRYGPEWQTNVSSPETNIYSDITNGKLAGVSWVIPDFNNSDHEGAPSDTGPSWVASVVNAIGQSQYWKSTAIVIVWDDWGGWYDHVPPPHLNAEGLGFRVPMLIVSPYARKGYVSHRQYEFGSILKFVEGTFGLASLGTTDVRAQNFATDAFDFSKPPRAFAPIQAAYPQSFFERQAPSNQPVDTE